MNRYWISWWQPGEDARPLHFPPSDQRVIGWWISGESEDKTTICALVVAHSEESAKAAVACDWPESVIAEWRFLEPKNTKWTPPSDRFPAKDWMTHRHATCS